MIIVLNVLSISLTISCIFKLALVLWLPKVCCNWVFYATAYFIVITFIGLLLYYIQFIWYIQYISISIFNNHSISCFYPIFSLYNRHCNLFNKLKLTIPYKPFGSFPEYLGNYFYSKFMKFCSYRIFTGWGFFLLVEFLYQYLLVLLFYLAHCSHPDLWIFIELNIR